jgi:NTE family protein
LLPRTAKGGADTRNLTPETSELALNKPTHHIDNELLDFLGKVPLFSPIPWDQRSDIAGEFEPLFMKKGSTVFSQGDPGDSMFVIKSGSVGLFSSNGGSERFITSLHRGDFFGEMSLMTGKARSATTRVILDAHLYRLHEKSFEQLLTTHPSIGLYLGRLYAYRFAESNRQVLNEPLPTFFAMTASHRGLGKSHFLYSLAYHLSSEAEKKVLIIELEKGFEERLRRFKLQRVPCPNHDLIELFSPPFRETLLQAWYGHPVGFMTFLMPIIKDKIFWEELEKCLPAEMDLLRGYFHLILFNLPTPPGVLGENVLRLCDRTLFLIQNTENVLREVQESLSAIRREVFGVRSDVIRVGVSHRIGKIGIPRDVLEVNLNLPETPAVWVEKIDDTSAERIDAVRRFPIRGPRALARELGGVRVGLALGAGGARGWAHLGVLKVLEEEGIHVDMIAGTSIGALVGSIYAKTASIRTTAQIVFHEMSSRLKVQKKIFDYTVPVHGMIRGVKILRMVKKAIDNADFLDLLIPFFVVAVDYHTGEEVLIQKGDVSDAVRGSISIPGIMAPHFVRGRWLLDGGLLNPVPVDVLIQKGADVIIAVCVERGKTQLPREKSRSPRIIKVLSRTMNIIHGQASKDFTPKADVVLYPEVADYTWDEFHRCRELMRAGEESCREKLSEIKDLIIKRKKDNDLS